MADFRLLTFEMNGKPTAGVLINSDVHVLADILGTSAPSSILELIETDPDLERVAKAVDAGSQKSGMPVSAQRLLAPVLYPGAMYIAGSNYAEHVQEMKKARQSDAKEWVLESPWHVMKASRACIVGDGATVAAPAGCERFDWEVELAVIVGRMAVDVKPEDALKYVVGYAVANDLSARDISRRPDVDPTRPFFMDWIQHKSFRGACPLGPWLTPRAAIADPQSLDLKLWVNGDLKQDSNTSNMLFGVASQLSALSFRTTLFPGDVILTGTPAGTAASYGTFLQSGDTVRASVEGLGVLTTTVG